MDFMAIFFQNLVWFFWNKRHKKSIINNQQRLILRLNYLKWNSILYATCLSLLSFSVYWYILTCVIIDKKLATKVNLNLIKVWKIKDCLKQWRGHYSSESIDTYWSHMFWSLVWYSGFFDKFKTKNYVGLRNLPVANMNNHLLLPVWYELKTC